MRKVTQINDRGKKKDCSIFCIISIVAVRLPPLITVFPEPHNFNLHMKMFLMTQKKREKENFLFFLLKSWDLSCKARNTKLQIISAEMGQRQEQSKRATGPRRRNAGQATKFNILTNIKKKT